MPKPNGEVAAGLSVDVEAIRVGEHPSAGLGVAALNMASVSQVPAAGCPLGAPVRSGDRILVKSAAVECNGSCQFDKSYRR